MTPGGPLQDAATVLLIDYPSRDVPETLARAGLEVVVQAGPGPEDYVRFSPEGDEVIEQRTGSAPQHADIVYVFRPVAELPGILELAREVGARTVWCESGSDDARRIVENADLVYVDTPSIVEAARG